MIFAECGRALSWGQRFSYCYMQGVFLVDFHSHVAAVECIRISLHWASDCSLKIQNKQYYGDLIINTTKFFSMKLRILCWLRKFIVVHPFLFALNTVLKDSFFVTCNGIQVKELIFCRERRRVDMITRYSLYFLLRVWEIRTPSLLSFPVFFKWQQIVD